MLDLIPTSMLEIHKEVIAKILMLFSITQYCRINTIKLLLGDPMNSYTVQ